MSNIAAGDGENVESDVRRRLGVRESPRAVRPDAEALLQGIEAEPAVDLDDGFPIDDASGGDHRGRRGDQPRERLGQVLPLP